MKKGEVKIGESYWCKVSGRFAAVRIVGVSPHGGWDGVNTNTRRTVRVRSAQRLRAPVRRRAVADGDITDSGDNTDRAPAAFSVAAALLRAVFGQNIEEE